ncbi:DUF397 domain-containing protein [Streptomyces sp. NPDC004959]|uniref:DUF397 domain-containing protein n=2 Tax=Streptomyces TaxID=1883 RepID=UPI0033A447B9
MAMTWKRSSYSGDNGGDCVEVGFDWRKSSYSGNNGGNCVEVGAVWRKSTHSGNDGGDCVEIAAQWQKSSHSGTNGGDCVDVGTVPASPHILVRDSKRATEPGTPVLHLTPTAFTAFLTTLSSR